MATTPTPTTRRATALGRGAQAEATLRALIAKNTENHGYYRQLEAVLGLVDGDVAKLEATYDALAVQYLFGLAACWLVERTRCLWAGLLLHALGNLAALGLYALCMFAPGAVLGVFGR